MGIPLSSFGINEDHNLPRCSYYHKWGATTSAATRSKNTGSFRRLNSYIHSFFRTSSFHNPSTYRYQSDSGNFSSSVPIVYPDYPPANTQLPAHIVSVHLGYILGTRAYHIARTYPHTTTANCWKSASGLG